MNKQQYNEAAPPADLEAHFSTYLSAQILLRNSLKQLAKLILTRHDRIPIDELGNLSCAIKPAISGLNGGFLFEQWFAICGKEKQWIKFMKASLGKESLQQLEELKQQIWQTHKFRWYGWLLKCLKDISNFNTKQLFWTTLAAKAKGLSNTGQDLFAKLGFTLQCKTFNLLEAQHLEIQKAKIHKQIQTEPHVWWIDNFNRTYGQTFYKLDNKSPMKVLNWTGWAIHTLPSEVNLQLLCTEPRLILPKRFQMYLFRTHLMEILQGVTDADQKLEHIFRTSFCEQHKVYNVPLKPYCIGPQVTDQTLLQLRKHLDGLHDFVPVELMEHNVGSEVGLAQVLRILRDQYTFANQEKYSLCKVDVNIFWRLYLIFYSRINPLHGWKDKLFVHLGWWHSYKHANELLWKKFLPSLLGPAFHFLFPKSKCIKTPKLTTLVSFFGHLTLAYKQNATQLKRLASWAERKKEVLPLCYTNHIKNLILLFEVLLPAVRDYGALLKVAKWPQCLAALQRLLIVFVTLAPQGLYARAVMLYVLLLHYWKAQFPQVSKVWEDNLPAFIEEDGELSFSVLSRTVLADSTKSSFATMNKAYIGQSMYREAMKDLNTDLDCFSRTASLHTVLEENSDEVKALSKFLRTHLKSIKTGHLQIYPKLSTGAKFYEGAETFLGVPYVISLNTTTIKDDPLLDLLIPEFEPPSLEHLVDQVLNSVDKSLLEANSAGCEIQYALEPEEVFSDDSETVSEEEEEEYEL